MGEIAEHEGQITGQIRKQDTEDTLLVPKGPIFARHETFHPRFGWLKKGVDAIRDDNLIFSRDNAAVTLGVGKNMVRSISYWVTAFKLASEDKTGKQGAYSITKFGERLFSQDGWDPYLEHDGSLWLLHWELLKKPCYATAWSFTFHNFRKPQLSPDELVGEMADYVSREFPTVKKAESSFRKDVSCILRMYSSSERVPADGLEDSIDSPFTQLGLISRLPDAGRYAFNIGRKRSLPPELVVAACLDFASSELNSEETISISRLLYDPGSPGMSFKLTESSLCNSIEMVASWYKDVSLSEGAGLLQLAFRKEPKKMSGDILDIFYKRS